MVIWDEVRGDILECTAMCGGTENTEKKTFIFIFVGTSLNQFILVKKNVVNFQAYESYTVYL